MHLDEFYNFDYYAKVPSPTFFNMKMATNLYFGLR